MTYKLLCQPKPIVKMFKFIATHFLFLVILLSCNNGIASQESMEMSGLTVINSEKELLLYGNLKNSFTETAAERLKSGIELIYDFSFEIYKTALEIPDELITNGTFQHSIRYDTLKDDYIISFKSTKNNLRFKSLYDAKKRIEIINDIPLIALNQLIPENNYKIRIKVERNQKAKILNPNTIMPLLKGLNKKTIWYEIKFIY